MAIQKKGLLIGGAALLLVAVAGICFAVLPSSSDAETSGESTAVSEASSTTDAADAEHAPDAYQSLMSQYYTAFIQDDPDAIYGLMAPPAYWTYYLEHYDKTKSDVIATYEQAIADTMADWEEQCGEDISISFSITGMSEQSEDFLTEWTEDMNEMLGEDTVHAQSAVTLQVERTIKGSSDTLTETLNPTLIEVDGVWYILQEDTADTES
jgi:hypothetical protein